MRIFKSVLSILFVNALALCCWSQDFQPAGAEKEHEWLRKFAGEWTSESKMEQGPGQPTMECRGTISSRMIGDLWVINEMKGEFGGMSMVGVQTIGWNPEKKKYVGTWVDNFMNLMWQYEGTVDESGTTITLEADGPNMVTGQGTTKFQDIYKFKSDDEMEIVSRMQLADGNWTTFMTGTAKRKQAGTAPK